MYNPKQTKQYLNSILVYCDSKGIKTAQEYIEDRQMLRDEQIENEVNSLILAKKNEQ